MDAHNTAGAVGEPSKEAQKFVREHARSIKLRFLAVRVCFSIILAVCIIIIWTSLISPLMISYFVMPSTDNLTRPFYDQLHQLFNNSHTSKLTCNVTGNSSNITCLPEHIFSCPLCVPICGKWHPFGDAYFTAYRIIAIFMSVIELVFSSVGAVIFIRVPGSLKFPKIIYLFLFVSVIILSIVFTIASVMGPHRFFCELRNEDHYSVAATPSLLVTILGAIAHYSYVCFDICFLVAAFNIFIIIYFPHWQLFREEKLRIILVLIESIVCLVLPVIFPVIHLSITHNYSFIRVPLLPFPLGDPLTPVYMVLGPLLLLTGIALTLIALAIYRVQIVKYILYKELVKFKSYEIRHMIFALQVWFTVTFIFIELSFRFANSDIFDFYLDEFWACTTLKLNPQFLSNQSLAPTECIETYKQYVYPVLIMFSYITTGLSSLEILVILTTKETFLAWKNSFKHVFKSLTVVSQPTSTGLHTRSKN